jgi:hypothetical protein
MDAEARLLAFSKRYTGGLGVRIDLDWDVGEQPWTMRWRREYPDALSDEREVFGASLLATVQAAEEWEAENDRREPQHAGRTP